MQVPAQNIVTKKGQQFVSGSRTITAYAFHGRDGEFYDTLDLCQKANPKDKMVCVINEEFGGSTDVELTKVVS